MMKPHSATALSIVLALVTLLTGTFDTGASLKPLEPRRVISLDGRWQIEQGVMDKAPTNFSHSVPVPGLADLSKPAFTEVGKVSPQRQAFWYRRTFKVSGKIPDFAILKIHKAQYGTKVWLNGQVVAEHLPCFTPAYLDVKPSLKGDRKENELIIRVGANRESIPQDMPTGWDFEKYLYIPGIYDSVELILAGAPYISNVQVVPDINAQTVRVVAEVAAAEKLCEVALDAKVTRAGSSKVIASATGPETRIPVRLDKKIDFAIPLPECRLWTPEEPNLYELTLRTHADAVKVRFGMRSFTFDPVTKRALLNGKPYYLRGNNVTLYRFFEDADRADLPWRERWVRKLHQRGKDMHWNSLRYCIGFPPEFWYDIADEEGILIQDEFPIWLLGAQRDKCPEFPIAEKIIPQYTAWMRERWNHAGVVIWDGQNESHTPETGKARDAVRHLDLSNRPWENGWAEPGLPTDCVESHPYLFINNWTGKDAFRLSKMPTVSGVPSLQAAQKKVPVSIIINEYCWLWLTRAGEPTCLTDKVYVNLVGTNATVAERRLAHARTLAALTEFWRCHREAAGVLHFCMLGYSRPGDKPRPEGGATSDHWVNLKRLKFEPLIQEYVGEAFNPVGLMLDFWTEEVPAGAAQTFKVYVINDRDTAWEGDVRLRLVKDGKSTVLQSQPCRVDPLGRTILSFTQAMPADTGKYTLVAELKDGRGTVRSLRDFRVGGP